MYTVGLGISCSSYGTKTLKELYFILLPLLFVSYSLSMRIALFMPSRAEKVYTWFSPWIGRGIQSFEILPAVADDITISNRESRSSSVVLQV